MSRKLQKSQERIDIPSGDGGNHSPSDEEKFKF